MQFTITGTVPPSETVIETEHPRTRLDPQSETISNKSSCLFSEKPLELFAIFKIARVGKYKNSRRFSCQESVFDSRPESFDSRVHALAVTADA